MIKVRSNAKENLFPSMSIADQFLVQHHVTWGQALCDPALCDPKDNLYYSFH